VARIIPDGANVVLDQQSIGSSGQFHDPPPGFAATTCQPSKLTPPFSNKTLPSSALT
jgi:hypothetical protein